jgi:hypothetical protein
MLAHAFVVAVRLVMVIVMLTKVDRKLAFKIELLSFATSLLNFSTTLCVI